MTNSSATVQICGTASNVRSMPPPNGVEVWGFNAVRSYGSKLPDIKDTYTRWFNFHSKRHILKTYPETWEWWRLQIQPIYLQLQDPEIPTSITFPMKALQLHFADDIPETFFNCSCATLIAFAIYERFERIELWGFEASDQEYGDQRSCIAYWVGRARGAGINVYLPDGVMICSSDRIYGYQTT